MYVLDWAQWPILQTRALSTNLRLMKVYACLIANSYNCPQIGVERRAMVLIPPGDLSHPKLLKFYVMNVGFYTHADDLNQ